MKESIFFGLIHLRKAEKVMIILSPNDLFTSRRVSLIADYDKETIFNLYQPLIGALASSLYMTFLVEAKNQKVTQISTHEKLMVKVQMTTKEFLEARGRLESVGLLKSYIENPSDDIKTYHYEVYAPKSPASFFENALLYGLLIKYIGEAEANRLKSIYNENVNDDKGVEISKTFKDVFTPDMNDPIFRKAVNSGGQRGRKTAKIDSEFNYDRFFEVLTSISQIKQSAITKKELKEIERIATLNGVDETIAANIVNEIYDASQDKGYRVNSNKLSEKIRNSTNFSFLVGYRDATNKKSTNNKVTSDSDLAKKIDLMESITPSEWLCILQNGAKPAKSDLNIIETISRDYSLSPSVINVLIDYILNKNHNILSKSYMEKVAASLKREGVESAIDAMNYLEQARQSMTNRKTNKKEQNIRINKETENEQMPEENEEDDISWEQLINELGGDK